MLLGFACLLITQQICFSQLRINSKISGRDTMVSAGSAYNTSGLHRFFWGQNYRNDWAVPVRVPVVYLDKIYGGLKPVKAGGGNQTKSLQLEASNGEIYTMRTVNKTLGKVVPKEFHGTFIEDLVNDKVSMSHPYGAIVVPGLATSARVFHTSPQYVYVPQQKVLDTFNAKFGNALYLLEQKVDGNWKSDVNLGNFSKYIGTEKLLEKLKEDNDNRVDQRSFIRARLLDMFINDWDRHEDQWEWGERKTDSQTVYTAVPQDRDQALYINNGVLLRFLISASGLSYFQPFDDDLKDVNKFNYEQRNLDRTFANQMSFEDWKQVASELQASLTDEVIDQAVKQMPSESYAVSGEKIAKTLKNRRSHISEWADTYYHFIAQEVDIIGSEKHEHFDIKRINDEQTQVNIYKLNKEGKSKNQLLYTRTFNKDETSEIRLYGLKGNDVFTVDGETKGGIKLRLIGGIEKDSITINSANIHVYDNLGNAINTTGNTKLHISEDTAINGYRYASFLYSKKGLRPTVFFTNEDRFFVGLTYAMLTQRWRSKPFASMQAIQANYSISQKAFSGIYTGLFPGAVGKADLALRAMYDQVRWTNFFGFGNETNFEIKDIDFYRARSEDWDGSIGLIKRFTNHSFRVSGTYRQVRVLKDIERYVGKIANNPNDDFYKSKKFAGALLAYNFKKVNDAIVPTKGVEIFSSASFAQNINDGSRRVANFSGDLYLYIPLLKNLSMALRAGGSTVTGSPEFYQYASLGGGQQLRAFRAGRYWGESAVYNSNELRYIGDVKSYLYNGKAGLLLFYDNGRVWMPGEKSNVWHDGYGFGIFVAPFNKIAIDVTYGFSRDDRLIQLRLARNF